MKDFARNSALSALFALALAGCDGQFFNSGDEVTVSVTSEANVRDRAAVDGSNVLTTLAPGTQLRGRWVDGASKSTEQWFAFQRSGITVFVWGKNLNENVTTPNKSNYDINKLTTQGLKDKWVEENGNCRGNLEDGAEQDAACNRREEIGKKLASLDWCFSSGDQPSYMADWRSCATKYENSSELSDTSYSALSENEKVKIAKDSCHKYLLERSFEDGFNFSYDTQHKHENWKRRYGDNYIFQYITHRVKNGTYTGSTTIKHCIVSKTSLEVLRVVNSDIVA